MTTPETFFAATDPAYLASCFAQRNPGPDARGSRFFVPQTAKSLVDARWEPYEHPAIQAPARAFRAAIAGRVGIVRIAELPPETTVLLSDPKGTGHAEAEVQMELGAWPTSDFTVLLVGPDRADPSKEVVWTFFPGEPIAPSRLPAADWAGTRVTPLRAIELGFEYAKVVG